jgi:hypothetical protein
MHLLIKILYKCFVYGAGYGLILDAESYNATHFGERCYWRSIYLVDIPRPEIAAFSN